MTEKKKHAQWWKLNQGKFVATGSGVTLDLPSQALVQDLIDSEINSDVLLNKTPDGVEVLKILESRLPFESVDKWMTWTIRGNEVNH